MRIPEQTDRRLWDADANHNNDNNNNLSNRRREKNSRSDSMLVLPKKNWKQQHRDFRREMSDSMLDVMVAPTTTRGCYSDYLRKGLAIEELDKE